MIAPVLSMLGTSGRSGSSDTTPRTTAPAAARQYLIVSDCRLSFAVAIEPRVGRFFQLIRPDGTQDASSDPGRAAGHNVAVIIKFQIRLVTLTTFLP
jgi:hypothetical protein